MEEEAVRNGAEGEDGFSFRPQQKKLSDLPHKLKSANIFQQPKKWSSRNKHSQSHVGGESKSFSLLEYPDHVQAQFDVENHFNKTFRLTPNATPWALPAPHTMFTSPKWQDKELQQMKISLNATKKLLGEKDISVWQTHTNNTNPAQKICYSVRRRTQPEMITQAWLKFYEILNAYPIVPATGDKTVVDDEVEDRASVPLGVAQQDSYSEDDHIPFNSLHLCEAPGAFITALNHYLAVNTHNVKWQWLGSTLNPYYEGTPLDQCITEDRFIYLTRDHWLFGKDNTGDLTKSTNLVDIEEHTKRLGPIHLVTGDGSFDCQVNPAEQESMTHPLHLCETTAALSVLSLGGSLVIKKFTFFECQSLSLVYLLCCIFQEVHLYKPGTSKQGNSEVYIIGLNYRGKGFFSMHLEKLRDIYGSTSQLKSMFSEEDLPEDFLLQMRECSAKFMGYQVKAIMRNLALFEKMSERDKQYNEMIKSKANALFFEQNFCIQIPKWKAITHGNVNKTRYLMESDWDKTSSSMLIRSSSIKSKLEVIHQFLVGFFNVYRNGNPMDSTTHSLTSVTFPKLEAIEFETVRGKPFEYIESSKFCSERIQRLYRESYRVWSAAVDSGQVSNREEVGDESLVATVMSLHPRAVVIRGEARMGPHPGYQALEDVVVSLEKGCVSEGGSVVVVGALLLSRLQYSLLMIIAAAFKDVRVYTGKVGSVLPVLVLDTLEPGATEGVLHALHCAGWSPGCSPFCPNSATITSHYTLLQLVAFSSLFSHQPLQAVHLYNTHLCSHLASILHAAAANDTCVMHT